MAKGAQQKRRAAAQPKTRAQRRANERTQTKRAPAKRSLPMSQFIGGLATILIVGGIIIYAIIQANSHKTTTHPAGKPVVTPAAYGPKNSLLKVGSNAPDFTLKGVDGKSYSLVAQKGHPVLLEFFAVYCPHCQAEAPTIERLKLQYAMRGVRFWSILASPYGPNYDLSYGQDTTVVTKADLQHFASTYHEHVPQLVDPNFHTVNKYGFPGYPAIYIVNKHGKIAYDHSGELPSSVLSSEIAKALNGKA